MKLWVTGPTRLSNTEVLFANISSLYYFYIGEYSFSEHFNFVMASNKFLWTNCTEFSFRY